MMRQALMLEIVSWYCTVCAYFKLHSMVLTLPYSGCVLEARFRKMNFAVFTRIDGAATITKLIPTQSARTRFLK